VTYVPSAVGPPASYPSTAWNGTFAAGNVTVTVPLSGVSTAAENSHYCKLTTLHGAPINLIWNHNTVVSNSTYVVNTGLAFNNSDTDGPTFGVNRAIINSLMLGGNWGSSAISTGNAAIQFIDDAVNSFTANDLAFGNGLSSGAYSPFYGLNQFYPVASPAMQFPATTCAYGFVGTGSWAFGCSGNLVPLQASDYHFYNLNSGSTYFNAAADGTNFGVQNISLLDNAQTSNLLSCGSTPCGSPGPFPDVNATVAPILPIPRSGVMLSENRAVQ
jgi:hypothetical protein